MFERYILGEITLNQLIDWVDEQVTLAIKRKVGEEEVDLDSNE